MSRYFRWLSALLGLAANLLPLCGILYWGWDTFQLLMLYWMETVIIAFWTLMGLSRLPDDQLGTMTINGRKQPATRKGLIWFFGTHAGAFILGHLFFLWVLFASGWLKAPRAHGIFYDLLVANGIWLALIFMFVAGWIGYRFHADASRVSLDSALHTSPVGSKEASLPATKAGSDPVGLVVGGLYVRIFIMQAAVIFGAMFAQSKGSLAPLLIVIGLKTLVDFGSNWSGPAGKGMEFSSGNTVYKT